MKFTKITFVLILLIAMMSEYTQAQKQIYPSKPKDGQTELIDFRIDNMGYWKKMAEKGMLPVKAYKKPEDAVYTGSKINAMSVKTEDSEDVPVADPANSTQSENSVFIDPLDNEYILNSNNSTSWSNGSASILGANHFISDDGGESFDGSTYGVGGSNYGDPTTAIGLNGRLYVNFINSYSGQGVAYSDDDGDTWSTTTIASSPGGYGTDKNHMWIDNAAESPYEGNLYCAWTPFGGTNLYEIVLARSIDDGESWETAINISSDVNALSHNQGVNLQTGPNGEVYACWTIYDNSSNDEKAIGFAKSTDGGVTFDDAERIIDDIRGIRVTETSKNMRVNSFPCMAVDISGGDNDGNIYIVWANVGYPGDNIGPEIDIYLIKSEDGGDTWTEDPIRVNQDEEDMGKEHYFPWITCDPETGVLSAIFYDDRNVSSTECEVFCANSFDAGDTWEDFKVSDVSFTPSPIPGTYMAVGYMGDYLGISARGGIVYPVWTDTRNDYMTYTSPYEVNTLAKPADLVYVLDEGTGAVELSWSFVEESTYLYFNVYRNNELLGTTEELSYSDILPDYGVHTYKVSAQHDDGESPPAKVSFQWGDAHIAITPIEIFAALEPGQSTIEEISIENPGELELIYFIQQEITSKKGSKDYCDAAGGCEEYISKVILGEIDNSSSCEGYEDYTDLSTLLNKGESYDITVENGNAWSSDDLGVWIDWNQDGDFEDDDENVVCEIDNGGEGTFSFEVPVNALPGETIMRVRIKYSGSDCGDPCGTTTYGEVEDYSVNVQGWISVDPLMDTVQAGETKTVEVSLDAEDLEDGVYTANLHFNHNDPDSELITVPVTLAVGEDIPSVIASADPNDICEGESTQLMADVTGGSGTFTYEWSSDPEGYTSTEQNPIVSPTESTTYYVEVYDGIFTVTDFTTIDIESLPGMAATPVGETQYCQDPQNSTYETTGAEDALSYSWTLTPENAGEIAGEGNVGIINWDAEFSGEAQVSVYGINDCGNGQISETLAITINALPDVTFDVTADTVCIYTPEFELNTAEPVGGEYAGTGVTEQGGKYYFNPETAGLGDHTITYSYTDENNCFNSTEDMINVSECLGINEIVEGMQVEIFPNPNSGKFTLKISDKSRKSYNVKVVNNLGHVVYSENNISLQKDYAEEINLEGYAEGIYFINIVSEKVNYVKKIVIRK